MSPYPPKLLLFCELDFWAEVTLNKSIEAGAGQAALTSRKEGEGESDLWVENSLGGRFGNSAGCSC